jgi:hypothetical protein
VTDKNPKNHEKTPKMTKTAKTEKGVGEAEIKSPDPETKFVAG